MAILNFLWFGNHIHSFSVSIKTAVCDNILIFSTRVPDKLSTIFSNLGTGLKSPNIPCMDPIARTLQRYDHRLNELVRTTGNFQLVVQSEVPTNGRSLLFE
ncbi:MAG: hypothetical protein CMN21_12105 [Rubinisphaera sp.]|nr:hypothetical protein [Rubinisphaera sp.]